MHAEEIAWALAASNPVHDAGVDGGLSACALCEVDTEGMWETSPSGGVVQLKLTLGDHKPTCPWRLAVEWVAEQSQPGPAT